MRFGGDPQVKEPCGMALLRLRKLSTDDQLFGRELLDGLEHGEARIGPRIRFDRLLEANQTRVMESFETIEDRHWGIGPEADNRLRLIEGPAAGKYRQPSEQGLLRRIEEIMAPADRSPQRLLSLGSVPATASQEREAAVETRQDRLRGQQAHARRSQLDGEREAVQAAANGDNRFRIVFCELEVVLHRAGTIDEEANRFRCQRIV